MTAQSPTSTKQVLYLLNARCEGVLQVLRDLIKIQKGMDATFDWPDDIDPTYGPRLHKASLHIRALMSWQMNGDVLHVMAPEIRAAVLALDPLVQDSLSDSVTVGARKQHSTSPLERELASFAHPTVFSLSLSREQGGFGNTGYVRYLFHTYVALGRLMIAFALAIAILAEATDPLRVAAVNEAIKGEISEFQALDLDVILRWADD